MWRGRNSKKTRDICHSERNFYEARAMFYSAAGPAPRLKIWLHSSECLTPEFEREAWSRRFRDTRRHEFNMSARHPLQLGRTPLPALRLSSRTKKNTQRSWSYTSLQWPVKCQTQWHLTSDPVMLGEARMDMWIKMDGVPDSTMLR